MTAINVIVLRDSVSIITDTLTHNPANGRAFHTHKCATIPHLGLAVATQGKGALLQSIVHALSLEAFCFDTARHFLGTQIRQLASIAYHDVSTADAWKSEGRIFVAGWSMKGPAAFYVSTMKDDPARWELIDIPYTINTPLVPDDVLKRFGADPMGNILDVLVSQAEAEPGKVGGFINATTIQEDGITQQTIGELRASTVIK